MSTEPLPRLMRLNMEHVVHGELLRADMDRALDVLDLAIRQRRSDLMRQALKAFGDCVPRLDHLKRAVGGEVR
jgi:hypothetical protein